MKLISGSEHPELSGWYGQRSMPAAGYKSDQSRTSALREVSTVRSVLNQMKRRPNYDNFDKLIIRCDTASNYPDNSSQTIADTKYQSFSSGQLRLFNITADPCEQTNVAQDNESLVRTLSDLLVKLASKAEKPRNVPIDRLADPLLHDSIWISWQDQDVQLSQTSSQGHYHIIYPFNAMLMAVLLSFHCSTQIMIMNKVLWKITLLCQPKKNERQKQWSNMWLSKKVHLFDSFSKWNHIFPLI